MLPPDQHDEFRAMWLDATASTGYIREYFGVSWKTIDATRQHLGLEVREHRTTLVWVPSPEEIVERASQARERWSKLVRSGRASAETATPRVEIKQFCYDGRSMTFS